MKRRPVSGGVAWSCPRCDGRTATFGLLRKGLDEATLREMVARAAEPGAAAGGRCPSCLKAMREVTLRTPGGYQDIDLCRRCNFVWFDPGEYSALTDVPGREPPVGHAAAVDPGQAPLRDPRAIDALARMKLEQAKAEQESSRRFPKEGWKWLPGLMGMPIEFDDHDAAATPMFTYVILGIVTVISGLAILGGGLESAIDAYGFRPSEAWRLGGLTTLTSFFLHVGWLHLLGNMYFLWIFGDNSEDVLGPARYVLLLALATILGCVLHAWITETPNIPAVGASGGISGIIGYYALRFPKMRIGVLFFFFWWLRMPTRIAFALWVGMQLFGAFVTQDNVAYMAHLGGALVGVAFFAYEKIAGDAPPPGGPRGSIHDRYGSRAGRYARGESHTDRYGSR